MIVVKILGGLGNQMFQYALGLALRRKGKVVKFDISGFKNYELHSGYELERIFKINESYFESQSNLKLIKNIVYVKILRLFNKNIYQKYEQHLKKNFDFDSNKKIFNVDNIYIDGYWQSELFFKEIEKEILNTFIFDIEILDSKNQYLYNKIKYSNSVSIHIRRGDYVNHSELGGICTLEYYEQAIKLISLLESDIEFYIFSNDVNWCKDNFKMENLTFVEGNTDTQSYIDMLLMASCKHNIIANSSFSWWGAYLNNHSSKKVIAPARWFNNHSINIVDLIPRSWIRI